MKTAKRRYNIPKLELKVKKPQIVIIFTNIGGGN